MHAKIYRWCQYIGCVLFLTMVIVPILLRKKPQIVLEFSLFIINGVRLMVTTSGIGACVLINSLFGLAMRHFQVFEYERHKKNQHT